MFQGMCAQFYLYKIIVEENKSIKLLIDCYNDKYVGIFPQMFLNLEMFLSIQDTRILMFFQLWFLIISFSGLTNKSTLSSYTYVYCDKLDLINTI